MIWDPGALPAQHGTTFVVTGANAGIGYFITEQLAGAGARVILASRSKQRTDAALTALRARVPGARVEFLQLDLADPDSVRTAASSILKLDRVDGLIENAGLVHPPARRETTAAGHEVVLATNFLGHFALTALVLPALERTPGSRIVSLGSMATRLSSFRVGDLQLETAYNGWRAYAQSKIAVQSFGFELDRRLRAAGSAVASLVAHPGFSISGLSPRIPGVNEPTFGTRVVDTLQGFAAQGKDRGAWAPVRAAIDPDAVGGQFWGPRFQTRGAPVLARPTSTSSDPAIGARVWAEAEKLTGLRLTALAE
jgi:NAD(P)-dependent dehydrogenase (short-subunit alcohol dehydrogenase family)